MSHRSNISITLDTAVTGGVHAGRSNDLIPKIMISSIVILFSIVLLILILHFYVRWHVLRRATRRARRLRRMIFAGDGQSPAASHAVDPAVLKSLPVLLFSGDGDLRECSVCLNEFEEGEKIRHLPRCGHSFHIDCIDMWFSSHSSCPLCRAAVEAVSSTADSPAATDLCSSCQREESIGSPETDSGSGEVVIDIPAGLIEGNGGEEEGLGFGRRHNAIWKSSRVLCLIWRSLTLNIWRKRVDGVVTDPELDGGETVLPPPATSPLSPTL